MTTEMFYETRFGNIVRPDEETLHQMYQDALHSPHFITDYPGLSGEWGQDRLLWEIIYVRKELAKLRGNMQ